MNVATFPMRDASPPLEVAFCACVLCLRPFVCYCFPRRKLLFLHACLHLPARLLAPSLYTPAPVSMIGYTTYAFRHRGSDFLIRATETSTSRYRITSLPYQFFLLSPSKNTPSHSTKPRPRPLTRLPPPKNEKNVLSDSPLVPKSPFD